MDVHTKNNEKRRISHDFRRQEEEVIGSLCRLSNRPTSPKSQQEQEKRIRREIANSNERRRMQSINAGFQSLRSLLPRQEGEKLSKAAILQHTSDYIYRLEQEKTRLLTQNCQLKRIINSQMQSVDSDGSCCDSPLPKRKKPADTRLDSSPEENLTSISPADPSAEDLRRELLEIKMQLDVERRKRIQLEQQKENACVTPQPTVSLTSNSPSIVAEEIKVVEEPVVVHVKQEPLGVKQEVPQDLSNNKEEVVQRTMYHASTSRQNLETIVEAIRHLEGDHLFNDTPSEIVQYHRPGVIVSNHS